MLLIACAVVCCGYYSRERHSVPAVFLLVFAYWKRKQKREARDERDSVSLPMLVNYIISEESDVTTPDDDTGWSRISH